MDFDLSSVDQPRHQQSLYGLIDPTFQRAHRLIFQRPIPLRLRYIDFQQNAKQLGVQAIIIRILVQGADTLLNEIKIQLRSEQDIFFNLDSMQSMLIDQEKFREIAAKQGLNMRYADFATILMKSLNQLEDQNSRLAGVLSMYSEGKAILTVTQGSEYKNIEIINLEFIEEPEEYVQQAVAHRYQTIKRKSELAENRIKKVIDIIVEKNPSLLLQIQRIPLAPKTQNKPPVQTTKKTR